MTVIRRQGASIMIDYESAADRMLAMGYRPAQFGPIAEVRPRSEDSATATRRAIARLLLAEGRQMTAQQIGLRVGLRGTQVGQILRVLPDGVASVPTKWGRAYAWEGEAGV